MANEVILRIGAEDSGADAALNEAAVKAKQVQEQSADAVAAAAREEEQALQVVMAQYGQLGEAAQVAGEKAASAADRAKDAEKSLSAVEQEIAKRRAEEAAADEARRKRAEEASRRQAEAEQRAAAAGDTAAAAVAKFGANAGTSLRAAESSGKAAAAAMVQLESEINDLRNAGANVEALEVRLRELQLQMEKNIAVAGRTKKSAADFSDELKASTARAGELEGQIGSLEGILNVLGASTLGNVASKAIALQGAFLVTVAAAKQIYEVLDFLTKEAGKAWEESLERQDIATRAASGETAQYAANLRNVLAKNGYDVASASLQQLMTMEAEFVARLRARGPAVEKLADQIRGSQKSLQDDTAVTLGALESLSDAELQNVQVAKHAAAAVSELIDRYKEAGQEIPDVLEKWALRLDRLADGHRHLLATVTELLEAVGGRGTDAIFDQIDAIEEYSRAVERSGKITGAQAQFIIGSIESIRKQVALLPEDQRAAVQGMLDSLSELENRYQHTASVALAAFGVQTPEAIARSVEGIEGLVDAFGPLGQVTQEQAEKVVAEAKKILEAIALLPAGEREAASAEVAELQRLVSEYGVVAEKRKAFSTDWRKQAEEDLAVLKQLASEFASVFDSLRQQLPGPGDGAESAGKSIEALTSQVDELRKKNLEAGLSVEELNKLGELQGQLGKAEQAAAGLAKGVGQFNAGGKQAVLTAEQVDGAIAGLVDGLKQAGSGWEKLDYTQRLSIEAQLGRLQQTAQEGNATASVLEDAFRTVNNVLDPLGAATTDLDSSLARAGESGLNLRREFGELDGTVSDLTDGVAEFGKATKDAAVLAQERAEKVKAALAVETEAYEAAKKASDALNETLSQRVDMLKVELELAKALKLCYATTTLGG